MHWRHIKALSALSIIALGAILSGANDLGRFCTPAPPAPCSPDFCKPCYCLGPENYGGNPPVSPKTCNGDFNVTVAGFYWNAHQDGMEYAIYNETLGSDSITGNAQLNNLFDANYLTPKFKWDFGFKLGLSYTTTCDGWDFGALWTHFKQGAKDHVEAEFEDNTTLLPLWSAFQYPNAGNAPILFASDIETFWKLDLNLVDIELGRQFWNSRYLTLRPHIGLRIAYIDQRFNIEYKGGSWRDPGLNINLTDNVCLDNDYKGAGLRAGMDSTWNLGCGLGLYGNLAFSIIYGKFAIDHKERLQEVVSPFSKTTILETEASFRASRAILDLGLGIQWAAMFCDCKYGLAVMLGWEQHVFFHQNQLWRVQRIGGTNGSSIVNTTGENAISQSRGSLDTQGWTLKLNFQF